MKYNKNEIEVWLVKYLAQLLGLPASEIRLDKSFDELGLDSTAAACMSGDLSDWLNTDLEPELAFKYKTISTLTAYLATSGRGQSASLTAAS